eukprot:SAG22_NODE_4342_length_1297_cov_1.454925_1_plen_66_part_00
MNMLNLDTSVWVAIAVVAVTLLIIAMRSRRMQVLKGHNKAVTSVVVTSVQFVRPRRLRLPEYELV